VVALLAAGCGSDSDAEEKAGAEEQAGTWKTWVLSSPEEVRVPPPPTGPAAERDGAARKSAVEAATDRQKALARTYSATPVVEPWLEQSMRLVSHRPKDPPASSRAYALVSAAMEDATVAAYRWKYRYDRKGPTGDASVETSPDPSYPSEHAAIAGAASRVIAYLYPEYPRARLDERAEDVAQARVASGANYPSDAKAGLDLGRAVAEKAIARAKNDGFTRKWDGKRPRGPEHWEPPPGQEGGQPNQPLAGTWKTWVLEDAADVRPPPPPKYGSKAFVSNARDVMRVKEELTPRQRRIAKFWEAGPGTVLPAGVWNRVAFNYVRNKELSVPRQARLFAMINVAMADAGGACWNAKYQTGWWDPRPINGIRDLGLDKKWKPLLGTPLFPAYPSGTSNYSGSAGTVLASEFPDDAAMWRKRATEAGMSRLWGGVHWRIDVKYGLQMGREVGGLVTERAKSDKVAG
jgi:membrane-associated phospholipid phosphatase